jgi:hypothetical protein
VLAVAGRTDSLAWFIENLTELLTPPSTKEVMPEPAVHLVLVCPKGKAIVFGSIKDHIWFCIRSDFDHAPVAGLKPVLV